MKSSRLMFLSAAVFLCVFAQQARPQSRANFWALNNTGKVVTNLYVSPHSAQTWGDDVLGQATLPTSLGVVIVFPPNVHHICVEDFKLVFQDGTSQTYQQGTNVCQVHAVQFNADTADTF